MTYQVECSCVGDISHRGYLSRAVNMSLLLLLVLLAMGQSRAQMVSYGMRRLALSMNQFGLDMLRAMESSDTDPGRQPQESYAFCPFCVGSSLAMLMAGLVQSGPDDSTRTAYDSLRHALYLNSMQPQEMNLAFFDLMRHLQVNLPDGFRAKRSAEGQSDPPRHNYNSVRIVNQLYVQRYLPVDYNYYVMAQHYFKTPIRSLDFAYASEESRQHINAMVEYASDLKVQGLLQDSDPVLWSHTRLLLLSALYFDGRLDLRQTHARAFGVWPYRKPAYSPFTLPVVSAAPVVNSTVQLAPPPRPVPPTPQATVSPKPDFDPFKPLDRKSIRSKESIRLRYAHNHYLNSTLVEMPFVGGVLSLLAIVPHSPPSIQTILSRLNAQLVLDLIQSLEVRRIDISMPSLRVNNSLSDMKSLLCRMGLASVFDSHYPALLAGVNFAGIESFPLPEVSQLHHRAVLDIDLEDQIQPLPLDKSRGRRSASRVSLVTSPLMKVMLVREGNQTNHAHYDHDSPNKKEKSKPEISKTKTPAKRIHVSLEEDFLYLLLDNVSGLILAMGRYHA